MTKPSKQVQEAFLNVIQVLIDDDLIDDTKKDVQLIGVSLGLTLDEVAEMIGLEVEEELNEFDE